MALDSADYFSSIGFVYSKFANPTDIFMQILFVNYPKTEDD
jgi:hypothetical protein